ncbi:MAG: condensation domain-containing protein [Cyanobacteria bacterium P01_G01_bin.38]
MDISLTEDKQILLNTYLKALGYSPVPFRKNHLQKEGSSSVGAVRRPPIGRPIANTYAYILDPQLQLTPVGVPGELYIGGAGLARGYLNRPRMTAEKFIANPFRAGRLYKTGDWARYRADGTIEFLGRVDHQVKIRGFRVELGEIETVLGRYGGGQHCAVMAHEESPGNQRLVAYVVNDDDLDIGDLKRFLKRHLLDYMVPSAFVALQALPLTPNGKLDRSALPMPTDNLIADTGFVAPTTPHQVTLARLFAEILSLPVERVGIHDSFFDLGGHSLLATQISARIRRAFRIKMPLRQLFETPTIADLAPWLADQPPAAAAPIPRMSREQPMPLSFAQERIWFIDQFDPGNVAYNQSAAVQLTGRVDIDALQQSLQAIVERHESLRTTFPLEQGQPVQQIGAALAVTLPRIDLQSLTPAQQQAEVQRLAIDLAQQPFNLAQGPLFRARILCLGDHDSVLLWSMHHIISDGWSMGVLVRDLAALYTASTADLQAPLKVLPIQYADFALWQRQWLTGDILEQQLVYWQQKLGGKLPVLRLPTDYPPPAVPSFRGATATVQLSANLVGQLQALGQEGGGTLFMALLAGFKTLLYAYTGQPDLIVGTDIANRNQAEVEDLIGFFVNLLVLRTDLSGNPTFRDVLQRVREVALGAYAHQDLPFAQLVQALQAQALQTEPATEISLEASRRGVTTPLFQVLFVLQNAPLQTLTLPDVTLTPLDLPSGSAKFDLALFLHETASGMTVDWNYSTDRFAAVTIERMAHQFEALLQHIVNHPDSSLESLANQVTQPPSKSSSSARRKQFKRVAPQAVQRSATDVVTHQVLPCGVQTIQPRHEAVDLATWAAGQQTAIHQQLRQQGALLFRGFSIKTATAFEQVAQAICPELFGDYGDLPRAGVSGKVYGSTPYPEDKAILFHNESSHLQQWPIKIWFCCLQPAQQGGATPIVDCRRVYQALSAEVRDRIFQKQLMYVRNYIKGLDVSWQDFFQTPDRTVVEQRCRATGMDWEWLEADGLQTRQVRPAIVRHPQTGDWVVFNQLQLHHLSYLDEPTQASLRSLFGEARLPRQVYYGDGIPIEPAVLDALQTAYTQAEQIFPWQQGDILMLDNMLIAHGRQAYTGPRKIAVAMAEIMTQAELDAQKPES